VGIGSEKVRVKLSFNERNGILPAVFELIWLERLESTVKSQPLADDYEFDEE